MPPYFTPPKNVVNAPIRDWAPLRANGNLTYREFIAMVSKFWNERVPDVPLIPYQGKNFARTPAIVYSLEVKTPIPNDRKKHHREFITNPATDQMYRITGQRFKHIVTFRVVTANEPELAEEILESFEFYMDEMTAVYKENGLSEIVYGRRLPDSTENRESQDVCIRAVAYEVTTEDVRQWPVAQLNEIIIQARMFVSESRNGFYGEAGNDYIVVDARPDLPVGLEVVISDLPGSDTFLPGGLHNGWKYTIASIDGARIYLLKPDGTPINITFDGQGGLYYWPGTPRVHIEDEFATPTS